MSGLDEKGLAAAANELLAHGEFSSIPSQNKPNAVIAAQEAIRAYLASATPADVGELVERLLHDHVQLGKMTEQASFLASGAVRVNDPSSLMADLRDAATALERVTRERDEWERRAGDAIMGEAAAIERAESAEAKLAEARKEADTLRARLETVEAETRERCAQVAEERYTRETVRKSSSGEPYAAGKMAIFAASQIAEAIRSLKETK